MCAGVPTPPSALRALLPPRCHARDMAPPLVAHRRLTIHRGQPPPASSGALGWTNPSTQAGLSKLAPSCDNSVGAASGRAQALDSQPSSLASCHLTARQHTLEEGPKAAKYPVPAKEGQAGGFDEATLGRAPGG